jgi:general L-amino acid transport system permease protein
LGVGGGGDPRAPISLLGHLQHIEPGQSEAAVKSRAEGKARGEQGASRMTTISEPHGESFRLSQLIYDTRYRSLTIQVIAFILIMLGLAWLANNTVQNLATLGKDFDFGFLTSRSGYDINQRLVEYSSSSTHARAALVGILNTLLVAILGCVLATIIGVLAGVLRLSNNWIVARLMTVYVEGFRNVPLLLWILVIFAVMSESMPAPSAFRGENPSASMIGDSIAVTNRGIYIPAVVFERSLGGNPPAPVEEEEEESASPATGGGMSFGSSRIATGSGGVSGQDEEEEAGPDAAAADASGKTQPTSSGLDWLLILGVLAASLIASRLISARADRQQEATGRRPKTGLLQAAVIILPTVVVLFVLGAQLARPELSGFNFSGGIHMRNSLIALWFALSLYTGAFIAEIVRAGILAVSKGQTEAAFALGIKPSRTMKLIILPQALRVIIPPLISQYLNLTKNSSLAIAVGYMDVRSTLGGITINQTGRELEGMLLLGLFYLVTSLIIAGGMNIYNNAVKLKER